ncbi:MAG: hypothetical protein J3K34DRAFT_457884 [Monoraphidium minutum]|nr:MAG: hypothetical protein J3K34DRAFT_457884 [Monoraphidium minutum]
MAASQIRALAVTLALLLAAAAAPAAHAFVPFNPTGGLGCIECSTCQQGMPGSDWCFQTCKPFCGYYPPTPGPSPDNLYVNSQWCVQSGASAGRGAAGAACQAARGRYAAQAGAVIVGSGLGSSYMPLSQCSNAAMGSCQSAALAGAPCQFELNYGAPGCGAAQFASYFRQDAQSRCYAAATQITDVAPGTHQWQPSWPFGGQQVIIGQPGIIGAGPVIIGSAAPAGLVGGGALGAAALAEGGAGVGTAAPEPEAATGGARRLLSAGRRMLRAL